MAQATDTYDTNSLAAALSSDERAVYGDATFASQSLIK